MQGLRRNGLAYICLIITVFMISFLPFPLSAASPTLNAEVKPSSDGKTVTVVFTVENNPGIAGFRFTMHYDNKVLKPVSAAMNNKISGIFGENIKDATTALTVAWANGTNYTGNDELCSATFSVIGIVKDGKYPITVTYDPTDIVNQVYTAVACETNGMTKSSLTVSIQSAQSVTVQSNPASSVSSGGQIKNSVAAPASSAALSAFSSSASSAKTSAQAFEVNSQIRTPDYMGSQTNSALAQSSQSGSQSKPGENSRVESLSGTSDTSYPAPSDTSSNGIPVQSPDGESPDLLLIAVLSIAAAAVIVLAVLIVKKKKQ